MQDSRIYSIYDIKSAMYGPAMTFVNDATAIRSFQEMLTSQDPNSLLSLYPADYILFCLGVFNQRDGIIESLPAPMNIMSGMDAFSRACGEAEERRARLDRLNGIDSQKVREIRQREEKERETISLIASEASESK